MWIFFPGDAFFLQYRQKKTKTLARIFYTELIEKSVGSGLKTLFVR